LHHQRVTINLIITPKKSQKRVMKAWLDSNMPGFITSWENLMNKFYNKIFPMSKVNECRKEISYFTQEEDEKFSESWERFQEMLIKCPPHGNEKWRLVQFFYQGLT
jgi:Ser-tRNA(Ala) deacylase AlaX